MINLGMYSHTIDYAGTWRSHERLAEVLQHKTDYKISIFYAENVNNNRLEDAKRILNKCKFIPFKRSLEKLDAKFGYAPIQSNIESVIKDNEIDLFHFTRSGYYEWPFTSRISKLQLETNVFGYKDNSVYLDGSMPISEALRLPENETTKIIYYPIPKPSNNFSNVVSLRSELGINSDALVFGRIGRPDNFTPISLIAFHNFIKSNPSAMYVIIGGCQESKNFVQKNRIDSNVIFLEPTNDDSYIERFHKTIDIFAHYRSDGETFGTAIAQAMIYGIPVITHYAGQNAQVLTIGPGGACVSNHDEYETAMKLLSNPSVRSEIGKRAQQHALKHYEQHAVVSKVEDFYKKIARSKNCDF